MSGESSPATQRSAPSGADLKIIFLGTSGAGKTSLLRRYTDNVWTELGEKTTIGASFALKKWCGKNFVIWDTAGQEKFDSLNNFYCRRAAAAILVFDITDAKSFSSLPKYVAMLRESGSDSAKIVLVGTKLDLVTEMQSRRQVSYADANAYAKEIDAKFVETSAKVNVNVARIFDMIGQQYYPDLDPEKFEESLGTQSPVSASGLVLSNEKKQFQVFVDPTQAGAEKRPAAACSC